MLRTELILHLTNSDCFPQDEYDVPGVAQSWRNAISGHEAYVPYEDELILTTWGQIIEELCIDPPLNNGYDSDYAVYTSFKSKLLQEISGKMRNP